jgi:hypothetical protein
MFIGTEMEDPMSASGTATRPEGRSKNRIAVAEPSLKSFSRGGECFCWMQRDIPVRLQPSDLHDPNDFHRRLGDWLMQQR